MFERQFRTTFKPTWCPGCGNYSVLKALENAVVDLNLQPENIALVSGIGCSGTITSYFRAYNFHGLHGRTLPVATGVKLANRELTVIAAGGDGDGFAIGLSHFIHTARRNINLTYIVMDNHIYGLTTGQASPTTEKGFITKTSPKGVLENPIQPLELGLDAGASYLAQGFAGDVKQLTSLITGGIHHQGFAFINVLIPCISFRPGINAKWYREKMLNLDEDPEYDASSREKARQKLVKSNHLCRGLIFRTEDLPSYDEVLMGKVLPLKEQSLNLTNGQKNDLLDQFI